MDTSIHSYITHNCSVWDYNRIQLQGPTSTVCGKYCCLFALYTDRGYTPKQFVALIDIATADKQISHMFEREFGRLHRVPRGGQC
jgi:hypothetical protein